MPRTRSGSSATAGIGPASRAIAPVLALLASLASGLPALAQGVAGPYLAAEHAAQRGDLVAAAERYGQALGRDPQNTVLLERALSHRLGAGQMPAAVALARRLEQLEPGRHIAVVTLAADALAGGHADRAAVLLESDTGSAGAFVGAIIKAWALYGSGQPEIALEMLRKLESDGTGGPAGQFLAGYHAGLIEAARGGDEAAAAALATALQRSGNGTRRMVQAYAGVLARLGRREEALDVLSDRMALTFSDPALERLAAAIGRGEAPAPMVGSAAEGAAEALYGLSRFLTRGANKLIGLGYARLATYLRPDLVDGHLLIAEQLSQDGQHALAIEAYDKVSESAPEALEARIGRADALEAEGRLEEGIQALRAVIARWPNEIEAHRGLGDMLRRNSRFAEAADAYDGAVALIETPETRHWPLFYQRGIALERSRQWPRAEADFRKALELEPDQPLVLNYLGYSWVEMGVNLDEAQAMIEKAVEQRPDDGYIVDSLGWVLYRFGDFGEAVKHLGRAVELRPVDPVINDHYGDALWMVGRKVEAEFQWHRALSFEPEEEVETRIRRKLALGLDAVLAEEAAAGTPAIIGRTEATPGNDGG